MKAESEKFMGIVPGPELAAETKQTDEEKKDQKRLIVLDANAFIR